MAIISREGGTLFKPLAFEWSNDPNAYFEIANNIMIGSAMKLSIQVTDISKVSTDYYFPAGTWC